MPLDGKIPTWGNTGPKSNRHVSPRRIIPTKGKYGAKRRWICRCGGKSPTRGNTDDFLFFLGTTPGNPHKGGTSWQLSKGPDHPPIWGKHTTQNHTEGYPDGPSPRMRGTQAEVSNSSRWVRNHNGGTQHPWRRTRRQARDIPQRGGILLLTCDGHGCGREIPPMGGIQMARCVEHCCDGSSPQGGKIIR